LNGRNEQPNLAFDGRDKLLSFETINQTVMKVFRRDDLLREKSFGIVALNDCN
jgi:hypothetical protein